MKKSFYLLAASAALMSCSAGPRNSFVINGSVSGFDKPITKVYLTEDRAVVDSADVVDGKFTFRGVPDSARAFKCRISEARVNSPVYVEPGSRIDITVTRENGFSIRDNGVNSAYHDFLDSRKALSDTLNAKVRRLKENGAPEEEIKAAEAEKKAAVNEMTLKFIDENRDNVAGASVFKGMCSQYRTVKEFDEAVASIRCSNRFPGIAKKRNALYHRENSAVGRMFIDFKGKDLKGNEVALSDYVGKGKYVIVDFWASWCGPCKREIPHLVKIQKKYAGKHFTVLGINVWDKDETFRKALKEHGINYPQIYASETREATTLYAVNGIPQIMLIAPDGKILARNLRGAAIEAAVKEALAK